MREVRQVAIGQGVTRTLPVALEELAAQALDPDGTARAEANSRREMGRARDAGALGANRLEVPIALAPDL
ncbi:MAG: hypothetical protein A2V88_00805 [Elusimicrobia bacterium RBG_16_66_12]|nr:MAG: hypothetical protein A2V88_00805 [Elusimicrobia bacterium RBG_16_66_12]